MIDKAKWAAGFQKVKFETTTKQYFGKYCFKLVLFSPGGRAIYTERLPIEKTLEIRQHLNRSYNYGGSWRGAGAGRYLNLADAALLYYIRTKRKELKDLTKFRVEEPFVTVYADSEDVLLNFARGIPDGCSDRIESVSGPESEAAMQLLKLGSILISKPSDYQFKVTLRDGRFPVATKLNLHSYLDGLGTEISLPKSCRTHLTRNSTWMYNVYFYCNDARIVSMLNLIEPNIVRNINSLVFTDNE